MTDRGLPAPSAHRTDGASVSSLSDQPIGVFDSGVGGLGILFELERLLPFESFAYYADSLHCPWGSRPNEEIVDLSCMATEALLEAGAKLIVVACNSATTVAISTLRERYAVPFVGTVPAVKPAALLSRTGRIGIMATRATVASGSLRQLAEQFASGVQVELFGCPDRLVELVEQAVVDGSEVQALLEPIIRRVEDLGVDVLVLGCTHYIFLRRTIKALAGPSISLLDTGEPVARQAARVLGSRQASTDPNRQGVVSYFSSASPLRLAETAQYLREKIQRYG